MSDATKGVLPIPPVTDRPVRLGVLISGGGTTLLNLLSEINSGRLNAQVATVIASRADCKGVERSHAAGLPCEVLVRSEFGSTQQFSDAVFAALRAAGVDLVVLGGFLSLLTVPDDFHLRVLNIHPSLIPAFCGKGFFGSRVHQAAIDRGVKISGCTVHFADNHYDHGPIVLQRAVEVPDGADAERLAELVFEQEKIAYPTAIRRIAEGRVRVVDHHTVTTEE